MNLKDRIEAFSELGGILRKTVDRIKGECNDVLNHIIDNQYTINPWFTPENVRMAVKAIADELTYDNLVSWTGRYPELENTFPSATVGVVMAGNIPLVGFHDFLCVLMAGQRILVKTSSKDPELIVCLSDILKDINGEFGSMISFAGGIISGFDAFIATGSNNSSRYFEYYFGRYPGIIRKNRNSVAIVDDTISENEAVALGKDIFSYFGLGCRNVSKIYIPEGFDLNRLHSRWNEFAGIIKHPKYANNYDFHKAVLLINKKKFIDTGYLIMQESPGLSTPVAVLNYEYYRSPDKVKKILKDQSERIQCITGTGAIPFGMAQRPALWDYADGTDTLEFILKKISPGIL